MQDAGIKGLFALLLLLFIGMRVYYYRKALYEGGAVTYHEPRLMLLVGIRLIGGVFLLSVLLLYFIAPQWLAWAALPLPFGLHLCGLFLGYSALLWLWWAQWTIGKNFSSILHARECHTLVMHGPYHWVRHPMYSGFYLFLLAWFLISANWAVVVPALLGLTIVLVNRLEQEEAIMIELFGDKYRAYMQRTGRFFPHWRHAPVTQPYRR